jgi:peptidoglycan L-alanyl-D-glutamate endopeptidase CwlK
MKTKPIKLDKKPILAVPDPAEEKAETKLENIEELQLTVEESGHKLGSRSKNKLSGCVDDIKNVTELALKYSKVDFGVTCGLRSQSEQRQMMSEGKTQTFQSWHLTGEAVDVVAYVDGKYTYKPWYLYIQIADAFKRAAEELNVEIVWGACWLTKLNSFDNAEAALTEYREARKGQGRKPFLDGVHFELYKGRDHP